MINVRIESEKELDVQRVPKPGIGDVLELQKKLQNKK